MTTGSAAVPELNIDKWEFICRRCGQCCFEKWISDAGAVRYTRIPCRHLDMITRECRVYEKRLEVGEGCVRLTPENVLTLGWLPPGCAYLELLSGGDRSRRRKPDRGRKRRERG